MKKTMLMVASSALVAALAGCGGGSGDGPIPLTVKMGTTPAVIPSVPKGESSVTVSLSVVVKGYAATLCVVVKDTTTGKVLDGIEGCPGNSGTLGPIESGSVFPLTITANVPRIIAVYVDGVKQETMTLIANCIDGTKLDANGVCN